MIDQGHETLDVRIVRGAFLLLMKVLFRIEYAGLETVPDNGPLVLVANHTTYFDPFWVATPVRRAVRFMAWDRIFQMPVAGSIFRWLGAFPVNLENPEAGAYKTALQILKRGEALLVFPEGGRSGAGHSLPYKDGAANLALRTGANVQPVVIHGGEKVWSHRMRLPRPRKVRVEYLPPVPADWLVPPATELTRRLRSIITERCRGEGAAH